MQPVFSGGRDLVDLAKGFDFPRAIAPNDVAKQQFAFLKPAVWQQVRLELVGGNPLHELVGNNFSKTCIRLPHRILGAA